MRQYTWDDILFFLAVARTGQLSSAARQLRTNHATVSRRIDRLEDALSARLFERNRRGYVLTPLGERLIELAEAMERDAEKFHKEASGGAVSVSMEIAVVVGRLPLGCGGRRGAGGSRVRPAGQLGHPREHSLHVLTTVGRQRSAGQAAANCLAGEAERTGVDAFSGSPVEADPWAKLT